MHYRVIWDCTTASWKIQVANFNLLGMWYKWETTKIPDGVDMSTLANCLQFIKSSGIDSVYHWMPSGFANSNYQNEKLPTPQRNPLPLPQ